MNTKTLIAVGAFGLLSATGAVQATTFTPDFSEFPFSGTQFDVSPAANAFYSANFGITVSNAFFYADPLDTFDGIGIANGTIANLGLPDQAARIDFIATTTFVSIDYVALFPTTYSAYASDGSLLDSFVESFADGTATLMGASKPISYITFTTDGGFGAISGLSYDYDGFTGGSPSAVPEPETYALMLAGLGVVGWAAARRRAKGG